MVSDRVVRREVTILENYLVQFIIVRLHDCLLLLRIDILVGFGVVVLIFDSEAGVGYFLVIFIFLLFILFLILRLIFLCFVTLRILFHIERRFQPKLHLAPGQSQGTYDNQKYYH